MPGRQSPASASPGFTLSGIERLLPPPPPEVVAARIETATAPGAIVADPFGRGGWIARAALDLSRRAVAIESDPLARLVAELVLRPPDLRHLDAAFQALGASPRGETSLRLSIGATFASRCATCGRNIVLDDLLWEAREDEAPRAPVRKTYRCPVCRDSRGRGEARSSAVDEADLALAETDPGAAAVRGHLRERFPSPDGGRHLVDEILDLHSPRQLVGLAAILERIETDLRAAAIDAALRLAFALAIAPASRLHSTGGRPSGLRISGGHVRLPGGGWRERNPWLAFEDGVKAVRGFIQRLEASPAGGTPARFGEDLRSLGEGAATAVVTGAGPGAIERLIEAAVGAARLGQTAGPRIGLVLGQPPLRPHPDRIAGTYHAVGWALGRDAAGTLPLEALLGGGGRVPWGWQAAAIRRTLEQLAPALARDARVVLLVEAAGAEALAAAVLGGTGAGYRLTSARLAEPESTEGGAVELVPPGAPVGPRALDRASRALPPLPGGAGDPSTVPGRGLFAPPERIDARPFSAAEAGETIVRTAVDVLKARGEPASTERLFGELLVGLDRAGLLRRLGLAEADDAAGEAATTGGGAAAARAPSALDEPPGRPGSIRDAGSPRTAGLHRAGSVHASSGQIGSAGARTSGVPGPAPAPTATQPVALPIGSRRAATAGDPVERLVALIRNELAAPSRGRIAEIEPGRWWLTDRSDRDAAQPPLADRLEWSVYSLLSTAGPISAAAFGDRIAALFSGPDLPDGTLVEACLDSYRDPAAPPDALTTRERLPARTRDHGELLALLADAGHRLGMDVWLGRREQRRIVDRRPLGDRLRERERSVYLPLIVRAPAEDVAEVDCVWYVRDRLTMMFEVEWTAILSEVVLRRHARIPADDRLVRFLAIPAERTELVRAKMARSTALRAAMAEGNWHIVKWPHLRRFLVADPLRLDDLEPYLGLDPAVERSGDQLPLFG